MGLEELGRFYDEFARELYVGGRKEGQFEKGNRFHRGMTLADLVTYTVFGRKRKGQDSLMAFIRIFLTYYIIGNEALR